METVCKITENEELKKMIINIVDERIADFMFSVAPRIEQIGRKFDMFVNSVIILVSVVGIWSSYNKISEKNKKITTF